MGVELGNVVQVERDPLGDAKLRTVPPRPPAYPSAMTFPSDPEHDVVASAQNLRAITLRKYRGAI
jgi:hypothetical protein